MFKITILFIIFVCFANAKIPFQNTLNTLKKEFEIKKYKKEFNNYMHYKTELLKLEKEYENINYSNEKKELFISKFKKLDNNTNSIFITAAFLDKLLYLGSLKNTKFLHDNIMPLSKKLYKNKLCYGYIYQGEVTYKLFANAEKALSIYKEGLQFCKLDWKKSFILSRYNILKYKKEKASAKK